MEKETTKSIKELIDEITKKNQFVPVENPNSTGLSPDLTDVEIEELIKMLQKLKQDIPIGSTIRKLRKQAGPTQEQVVAKLQ